MIRELSLVNFKAFGSVCFPLRPLVLFSGVNGTGKSTVMQSLGLLCQSQEEGGLDQGQWILNGSYVELGTGQDVLFEAAEDEVIAITGREDVPGHAEFRRFRSEVAYSKEADVLCGPRPREAPPAFPGEPVQYLRADRIVPATTYPKSHHVIGERRFLGAHGEFTAHFLDWHRDDAVPPRRRHAEAAGPGLFSQVTAWMQQVSPGVSLDIHNVERTDFVRLAFGFMAGTGVGGVETYRPTNVGFGLTYTLPIVVAALSAPAGSLVMVENPEAHLHPAGQVALARLAALAAADGVQVLVETHSDHILNGLRLAVKERDIAAEETGIHFFSKDKYAGNAGVEFLEVSPTGRLPAWPRGFFDQFEDSLDRLLD
jgi:predicted ATPase